MSQVEIIRRPAVLAPLACRIVYETVVRAAGSHRGALLQVRTEALTACVRRGAARSSHIDAPGAAAVSWLKATFRQDDEALRRAAVAALALGLDARVAAWPPELLELHPAAHARLAAFLTASRPYHPEAFSRDMAFVAGLASPAGALTVCIPDPDRADSLAPRIRRAAGAFCRQVLQYGAAPARAWLEEVGARPWAELHVDLRMVEDFNAEGFLGCYRRLAALMRARTDLAGVCGASWLYDPQLAHVSPDLAFVRRTAEDGGARLIRLRPDPVQTTYATARSPVRRRLVESGAYRPVCYGMYWTRADLIAWADRSLADKTAKRRPPLKYLQVVRE